MLETLTPTSPPPLGLKAVTSLSLGGVHFFATLTPTSLPPLGLRGVTSLSLRAVTPTARVCCSSAFLASRVLVWVCAGRSAGVGVARQLSLASPLPVAAVAAAAAALVAALVSLVAAGAAELKRAAAALAKLPAAVSANSRHAVLVALGRGEGGGGPAGWSEGGASGGRRKSGVGTSRSRPVRD
jgi:hypothetical protein